MQRDNLRSLVAAFQAQHLLIVGDVMLDEYHWGTVRRISPEAPVPVVEVTRRSFIPGGAANVAANVVALGGAATLVGVVGHDPQAGLLRAALEERGVPNADLLEESTRPTTTKMRIVAHNQQVVRVDSESISPIHPSSEEHLLQRAESALHTATACIVSDYAKGVVTPRVAERIMTLARQVNIPVIVDPKGRAYDKYRGATLVTPNVKEAGEALNCDINDDTLSQMGQALRKLLGGSAVLVTQGAEGMTLFEEEPSEIHIPAVARSVFDVTGAGDTVISTLGLALGAGATLVEAAHLAALAAGLVVGKVGTATLSPNELLESLETL